MKLRRTLNIILAVALAASLMSGFGAAGGEGSGEVPENVDYSEVNLFDPVEAFDGIFEYDVERGVVTNGGIRTCSETFYCPDLTRDYTFGGHVKITGIGEQAWNGVRFIVGSDAAGTCEILITRDWGTRFDFGGSNLNDAYFDTVQIRLREGTEFDFEITRKGRSVVLMLNGKRQCKVNIPEELDRFEEGGDYLLGFTASECGFEVSDMYVYCTEAAKARAERATATVMPVETAGSETPGAAETVIPENKGKITADNAASVHAVDALGRTTEPVSGFLDDRYVGLFYFTWFGHTTVPQDRVYNVTEILREDRDELFNEKSEKYPLNALYHFNEPLFGYYSSDDEWIIRRHLELFIDAGVDFLALDFTNAIYYGTVVSRMLDVYLEYQKAGRKVPQLMFFTNLQSGTIITRLYKDFYVKEEYASLWFRGGGEKPYVIGWESEIPAEIREKFTVRPPQWPNAEYMEDGWPYVDLTKPQPLYTDLMSVSVAQHTGDAFSFSLKAPGGGVRESRGRGFTLKNPRNGDVSAILRGDNFKEEWDAAVAAAPRIVFVTGWNEWIAHKMTADWSAGVPYWVDTFNTEYSRDIEMTRAATYVSDGNGGFTEEGYGDNYYLQLCENIRRYKGIEGAPATVSWDPKDAQVDREFTPYVSYTNTAVKSYGRDSAGFLDSIHYSQPAPDNFVKCVNVSCDSSAIRFEVVCENDVVNETAEDTLNVLFGFEGAGKTWETFEYRVRCYENGAARLEKISRKGEYSFEDTGLNAKYIINENVLTVAIERKDVGKYKKQFTMYFKVTDSVNKPDDILDYYVSGCSVPLGRMTYSFKAVSSAATRKGCRGEVAGMLPVLLPAMALGVVPVFACRKKKRK
ncbi:MAG: hypothetical protein J5912_04395 [Clostridia bacterium]|nr:hypothetical protein [Clostridia bacterium]